MQLPEPFELPLKNPRSGKTGKLRVSNAGFAAIFELFRYGERIAYVNCAAQNLRICMICDFRVGEEAREEKARPLLARILNQGPGRGEGWGTALLEAVLNEMRRSGFQLILAEITPEDSSNNRDLLGWYEKHGFVPTGAKASYETWIQLGKRL